MEYVWFSLGFVAIHLVAYVVAGVVSQTFSSDIYHGDDAVLAPILRDVTDEAERSRQAVLMIPAQLTRGLLMSVVLWPVLGAIGDLALGWRIAFLSGLMFVYTDVASATPFVNNIEGLVYLKRRFVRPSVFARVQVEAVIYSLLFGVSAAWLLV